MIDFAKTKITTALAKANSNVARTFQGDDPELSEASDYLREENGRVRHWAPTTGAATESVHRTRAEIVLEPFEIDSAKSHTSDYKWHLEKVNYKGEFVFQQIHCDDGNDPTLKLFGRVTDLEKLTGQILYGLRTANTDTDPKKKVLLDKVDFTKTIHSVIELLEDGTVNISAENDGNKNEVSDKLSAKRAARPHVPHFGPYNQVDMGGEDEPEGDGTLLWSEDIEFTSVPKDEDESDKDDSDDGEDKDDTSDTTDPAQPESPPDVETPAATNTTSSATLFADLKADLDKIQADFQGKKVDKKTTKTRLTVYEDRLDQSPDGVEQDNLRQRVKAIRASLS